MSQISYPRNPIPTNKQIFWQSMNMSPDEYKNDSTVCDIYPIPNTQIPTPGVMKFTILVDLSITKDETTTIISFGPRGRGSGAGALPS